MVAFLDSLKSRNELLFYFGIACLTAAFICLVLTKITAVQVLGVSAWFKPFKFFLSTFIFSWTIGWILGDLSDQKHVVSYSWMVVIILGLETLYIAFQAGKGQLSHFNTSTPLYGLLYSLMALCITILTLWTAYIGILFFTSAHNTLPDYYLWGIRLGILMFVVFAFQGFLMGSRMAHTVGGADGSNGIPVVNWSTKYGDLRIAHFLGMHALQLIPLVSFYILKNVRLVILFAVIYFVFTTWQMLVALAGKPVFRG